MDSRSSGLAGTEAVDNKGSAGKGLEDIDSSDTGPADTDWAGTGSADTGSAETDFAGLDSALAGSVDIDPADIDSADNCS